MRTIRRIIIHCTATPEGRPHSVAEIRRWHTNPKENADGSFTYQGKKYARLEDLPVAVRRVRGNGWSDIGYHYLILLDGTLEVGRPVEKVGAHVAGHNADSIGVCYVGGTEKDNVRKAKDTRTPEQDQTLHALISQLRHRYPMARVLGHRDLDRGKACPSFDVSREIWAQ